MRRNILTPDDEKLKFIPHLNSNLLEKEESKKGGWKNYLKELESHYTEKRLGSSLEIERAARIRDHLDELFETLKINCNQDDLVQYILSNDDSIKEMRMKLGDRKAISESLGGPLPPNIYQSAKLFCEAFKSYFDFPFHDVILPTDRVRELTESVHKSPSKTPEKPGDRLATYTTLTCMICQHVDCHTHGDFSRGRSEDDENDNNDETSAESYLERRVTINYDAMVQRYNIRKLNSSPEFEYEAATKGTNPCSPECYLNVNSTHMQYDFPDDGGVLDQMRRTFSDKTSRSCNISFLLSIPCWKVYDEISRREEFESLSPVYADSSPRARVKGPSWYDNRRRVLKGDWQEMTDAHLHEKCSQANPVSVLIPPVK